MRWPVSKKSRANFLQKNPAFHFRAENYFCIQHGGLLFPENFRVRELGGGGRSGDVQRRVESQRDWRQAKFGAASLVAELERNVLLAERGALKRRNGHAKNHGVLIDVQRNFRKREFFEFALGIGNFAGAEARGECGLEIGGYEIFFRFFAGIDVESWANLHDHGNLKRTAAADGIERGVDFRLDHLATGRNLRWQRCAQNQQAHEKDTYFDFHNVTCAPSCWEMTRLITA